MTRKIVIIGGGFAGVNLAKKLGRDRRFQVTLVDRNNYNFFPPLLYQVATGFLEVSSISYPFRKMFRRYPAVHFRMAEFLRVDTAAKQCYLSTGTLDYDILVFATGAKANYFGNESLQRNSLPMKNIEDALRLRNTLLSTLERASISNDPAERKRLLTIVVAGGGPTGVEVSGVLAECRRDIIYKDYPELKDSGAKLYLVESSPSLLVHMSKKTHAQSQRALEKLGVEVRLNTQVKGFCDGQVNLSTGEAIPAENLIWTAGVQAGVFEGIPASSLARGNRMITGIFNQVKDLDGVYAIGDISSSTHEPAFPNGHPQLAQVAIQQGQTLAHNLLADSRGKARKPFRYVDKGTLAIIGRNKAVADLLPGGKLHIGGLPALFIWLFVHLIGLMTAPNRVKTLWNWMVAYITRDQALRMIVRPGATAALKPLPSGPVAASPSSIPAGDAPVKETAHL